MVVFRRSNKPAHAEPATAREGGAPDPFAEVATALREERDADAVRLFLRVSAVHPLAAHEDMLPALREVLGGKPAERLVLAFATFPCPHCRAGSGPCSNCNGSGRGEDRRFACMTCLGLGVAPCDFCGGSGFETYNSVPAGLRPAVAAVRMEIALGRLERVTRQPLPPEDAAPEQLKSHRKALAKQVLELARERAILVNVAQLARHLRAQDPGRFRGLSARLFGRSSRGASELQGRMAQVFLLLARASRGRSAATGHPADTAAFELERAGLFEEEARRLERASHHRASLFPGH